MIEIMDIGASNVDGPQPYQRLLTAGLGHVTGFEPNPREFVKLQRNESHTDISHTYLPYALGDGAEHRYYEYAAPGLNGLLPLREDAEQVFPEARAWMELRTSYIVQTHKLDDLGLSCDFLHLDCQGSELMIIQNATRTLHNCLAIQLEVSFFPIYAGQPLFSDIDAELRLRGFLPWSILGVRKLATGQLQEADMLYVRYWPRPDWLTAEQRIKLADIMEHSYDEKIFAEKLRAK